MSQVTDLLIKTDDEHTRVLARISELVDMDPSPESEEGKELEILSTLVRQYEDQIYGTDDMEISDEEYERCLAEERGDSDREVIRLRLENVTKHLAELAELRSTLILEYPWKSASPVNLLNWMTRPPSAPTQAVPMDMFRLVSLITNKVLHRQEVLFQEEADRMRDPQVGWSFVIRDVIRHFETDRLSDMENVVGESLRETLDDLVREAFASKRI